MNTNNYYYSTFELADALGISSLKVSEIAKKLFPKTYEEHAKSSVLLRVYSYNQAVAIVRDYKQNVKRIDCLKKLVSDISEEETKEKAEEAFRNNAERQNEKSFAKNETHEALKTNKDNSNDAKAEQKKNHTPEFQDSMNEMIRFLFNI